jgi:lipoprotein-anchoring transpeptidase ErfK/SrfK
MRKLAAVLAALSATALAVPLTPAMASLETPEAKAMAASAVDQALADMDDRFGEKELKPGAYVWREPASAAGPISVIVSLDEQKAFVYRGADLVAVSTISSGTEDKRTPKGIFTVLEKKPMHHSRKYDNAPMPFMQRIDKYGVALHAGHNPGYPASHGCIRLPAAFAKKLYGTTGVGTSVYIG